MPEVRCEKLFPLETDFCAGEVGRWVEIACDLVQDFWDVCYCWHVETGQEREVKRKKVCVWCVRVYE